MLIVTVDEKEYLRLGLLLEEVFADCTIQMISTMINPASVARAGCLWSKRRVYFLCHSGCGYSSES